MRLANDLSVTNSAYVVTGKDCSSLRGTWLYPIFIFLYYMIVVLGSRRYCYHDWFMWGFLSLFGALVKGEFSGGAICVRGM